MHDRPGTQKIFDIFTHLPAIFQSLHQNFKSSATRKFFILHKVYSKSMIDSAAETRKSWAKVADIRVVKRSRILLQSHVAYACLLYLYMNTNIKQLLNSVSDEQYNEMHILQFDSSCVRVSPW